MTRKTIFRLAWALTVMLAFGLGCQLVDQVKDVVALATDVGLLATDIDLEGLATDIDLSSISTEMESMSTEMGSVITEMGSFITDIPLIDETPGPVNTPNGFPLDIPVMDGEKSDMSGSASRLEYSIDVDQTAAVDFYRREMAARGWVEQGADIQTEKAKLTFRKDNRTAEVTIIEDFFFGLSIEIEVRN